MSTNFGLREIGQIMVPVGDLPRATAFYRDALGMPLLFEVPGMAFFNCGGIRLLLGKPEASSGGAAGSIIYYKVPEIDATHRMLVERGVAFKANPHLVARMPDHELWMAFFADSEGNTLALLSEAPLR